MWTACTKKPVTAEGLQQALAITHTTKLLDADNMPDLDLVIEVCSGLIKFDESSKVIRLIHFTAQEYFQRKWQTLFANAHSEIAWVCASYLSSTKPEPGEDAPPSESQWPSLYEYAFSNWQYHALLDETGDAFAHRLLNDPSILAHWEVTTSPLCLCADSQDTGCFAAPANASPLHFAVYYGTDTTVKALLKRGLDCNAKDKYQRTPLAWAAQGTAVAVVRVLLDAGADVNHVDYIGWKPLFHALARGNADIIRLLVSRGAIIDRQDNAGRTAVSMASIAEDRDAIRSIFLDRDPVPILRIADPQELYDIVEWARHHKTGGFVRMIEEKCQPEVKSASLLVASREGLIDDVKRLLSEGANPDYRDPAWGRSPLSQAAEYDRTNIVYYLLESGVPPDMLDINGWADSQNNEGNTPLHWAIRCGQIGPFRALLEHGADIEKAGGHRNEGGLQHVMNLGRTEMLQVLREQYSESDIRDDHP